MHALRLHHPALSITVGLVMWHRIIQMIFRHCPSIQIRARRIAYGATPSVTEQMLVNMFTGNPPGNTDRILDFSRAVTGGLFFAPSADFLDALPDRPGTPGAEPAAMAEA